MPTRQATLADITPSGKARLVTWTGMNNGDDGAPVDWVDFADRCFQVSGTFGSGGSCTVQGSNDATNWAPLTDPQGNALTFTSQKMPPISAATASPFSA